MAAKYGSFDQPLMSATECCPDCDEETYRSSEYSTGLFLTAVEKLRQTRPEKLEELKQRVGMTCSSCGWHGWAWKEQVPA